MKSDGRDLGIELPRFSHRWIRENLNEAGYSMQYEVELPQVLLHQEYLFIALIQILSQFSHRIVMYSKET